MPQGMSHDWTGEELKKPLLCPKRNQLSFSSRLEDLCLREIKVMRLDMLVFQSAKRNEKKGCKKIYISMSQVETPIDQSVFIHLPNSLGRGEYIS